MRCWPCDLAILQCLHGVYWEHGNLPKERLDPGFASLRVWFGASEGGSGEPFGLRGTELGNARVSPERYDGLTAQVGAGYGFRK